MERIDGRTSIIGATVAGTADLYRQFIRAKRVSAKPAGFEVERARLNPRLKVWQADIVQWACRLGRAALFEDCGLGKSFQELEWSRLVWEQTGLPVLLCEPILVGWQILEEAAKFKIDAPVRLVSEQSDVGPGINVTNYERLHKFDADAFGGFCAGESSILKNFMGKRKQQIMRMFAGTPFKLACTATPAPNDLLELGNHADFLDVMPSREMIARWFSNDTMHAGKYKLKPHGAKDYWRWVSSWAVSLASPSDLGYSDEGYQLPPLNIREVVVDGCESWFGRENYANASATNVHKEKRATLEERCQAVAGLCNSSQEQWAIWCGTNYEADVLIDLVKDCVEVRGSHNERQKEERLKAFQCGDKRAIITKSKLAGFGLNWQHCHKTTWFAGYSYEEWYQAVRRMFRFGQELAVDCYLVASENELGIVDALKAKAAHHQTMRSEASAAMREFQIAEIREAKQLQEYRPCKPIKHPSWLKAKPTTLSAC